MWYLLFEYVLIGPILRILGRPRVSGTQNLPTSGPVIIAGNHLTVVDSFFLVLLVRRRVTFIAKSEYFTGRGIKGAALRWFYSATGQVPVDRRGADASAPALAAAKSILRQGKVWAVYPEGTRSPDGRLYTGKTGLARVAIETGAPVVPLVMHGTLAVNPVGSRMWRPGKVRMVVGEPLDFTRYAGGENSKAILRAVTDEVMAALANLSGQEYVDVYAASVKEAA
ncbi:1-acyl-sn-glycerol-3-phosphate acyltransferase [Rhodococcus sp. 15-725-2-2b]|uniref:lysophospholipid acyltransferase family protein n=1 Tax=unclassified Rhodococcus (in: high G+C Gram-positive bacteria) TaxID=192944 RepID=UPI000B9A53BC|nr:MULTISPECIES: lysophospholipid acyltransferase family protein [unclassified Rhodococcus (in: high G+C Gram-positive bacteria)]OZC61080.1 1-acyl-sn-glycerol-3-phosphate acyltransferase [Rhodococcus sp. 06-470-2]OZC71808.1 1-acyl-sn-glycerol-3-phosphate acyltransferase [Rhodococcus sp. 06-469-3-2]OZD42597.1 1-acyl-sn-glycerol-3-phosphate acyltransferase [Rhodococcus sp. 06-1477-1A]OZE06043.1 1-acyl-sn-glycerol-3-phosphate acyltransferase [Rhodococcus sp. 05-2255-3B1]OZE09252.1 1-acyl-sn-glyce